MKKSFFVLFMFACSMSGARAGEFSMAAGFDYSTGKYGNAVATDILYFPFSAKYKSGPWTLKLTVPYIQITGPDFVTPAGRFTATTTNPNRTTSAGLGDVITQAGYNFYSGDALDLDVVGRIKFGTADPNKGLGTGKDDYSGQIDAFYTISRTMLFGTLGYKIRGSPVVDVVLNNGFFGGVGVTQRFTDRTKAGIMMNVVQPYSIYTGQQREATIFIIQRAHDGHKVMLHFTKGFTDSSPDYGFGVSVAGAF